MPTLSKARYERDYIESVMTVRSLDLYQICPWRGHHAFLSLTLLLVNKQWLCHCADNAFVMEPRYLYMTALLARTCYRVAVRSEANYRKHAHYLL